MFAVVYGNPFDGLEILGPFDSHDEATDCAEWFCHGEQWNVVPMTAKPERH